MAFIPEEYEGTADEAETQSKPKPKKGFDYAKAIAFFQSPEYDKLDKGTRNVIEIAIGKFEEENKIANGLVWDGYDHNGDQLETKPFVAEEPKPTEKPSVLRRSRAPEGPDQLTLDDRVTRRGGGVLQPKSTKMETAGEFARQGFSFGFSDELDEVAVEAAGGRMPMAEQRGSMVAVPEETASQRKDRLASQHPGVAAASEMGAGLLASAVGGAATQAVGKGVPLAGRIGGRVSSMLTNPAMPIRSGIARGAVSSVPGAIASGAGHADGGTLGERLQAGVSEVPMALGLGGAFGGLIGGARSIQQGTRANPQIGPALQNVEAAGGKTSVMKGVTPPPGVDVSPRSIGDRVVSADRAAASEAAGIISREGPSVQDQVVSGADAALEQASQRYIPEETFKKIDDALENGDLDVEEAALYKELAARLTKVTDKAPTDRPFRPASPQNLERAGMSQETIPPPASAEPSVRDTIRPGRRMETSASNRDTIRPSKPASRRRPKDVLQEAVEEAKGAAPSVPQKKRVSARASSDVSTAAGTPPSSDVSTAAGTPPTPIGDAPVYEPPKKRYMAPKSMPPRDFDEAVEGFERDAASRGKIDRARGEGRSVREGGQPFGRARGAGSSGVESAIKADRAKMGGPEAARARAVSELDRLERGRRAAGLKPGELFSGAEDQTRRIEERLLGHGDRPGDEALRSLFEGTAATPALHRIPLTRETLMLQGVAPNSPFQALNPISDQAKNFYRLRFDPLLGVMTGNRGRVGGMTLTPSVRGSVSSIIGANEGRKREKKNRRKK